MGFLDFLKKFSISFAYVAFGFLLILLSIGIIIAGVMEHSEVYSDYYVLFNILAGVLFFIGIALMYYGRKKSPIRGL